MWRQPNASLCDCPQASGRCASVVEFPTSRRQTGRLGPYWRLSPLTLWRLGPRRAVQTSRLCRLNRPVVSATLPPTCSRGSGLVMPAPLSVPTQTTSSTRDIREHAWDDALMHLCCQRRCYTRAELPGSRRRSNANRTLSQGMRGNVASCPIDCVLALEWHLPGPMRALGQARVPTSSSRACMMILALESDPRRPSPSPTRRTRLRARTPPAGVRSGPSLPAVCAQGTRLRAILNAANLRKRYLYPDPRTLNTTSRLAVSHTKGGESAE